MAKFFFSHSESFSKWCCSFVCMATTILWMASYNWMSESIKWMGITQQQRLFWADETMLLLLKVKIVCLYVCLYEPFGWKPRNCHGSNISAVVPHNFLLRSPWLLFSIAQPFLSSARRVSSTQTKPFSTIAVDTRAFEHWMQFLVCRRTAISEFMAVVYGLVKTIRAMIKAKYASTQ